MPLTPDQEAQMLSREDRLGLAKYVIAKSREANRLASLEKDELMASANLADLIKTGNISHVMRNLLMPTDTDQSAHLLSLISTFIVQCLDAVLSKKYGDYFSRILILKKILILFRENQSGWHNSTSPG